MCGLAVDCNDGKSYCPGSAAADGQWVGARPSTIAVAQEKAAPKQRKEGIRIPPYEKRIKRAVELRTTLSQWRCAKLLSTLNT